MPSDPGETTVIYNDACPICSREVAMYRRASQARGLPISYAGLSQADLACFGLTQETAAKRFHVVKQGEMLSGLPAFAVLWEDLPRLRWLARLVRLPVIAPLANAVYDHILAPALYALHMRRERRKAVSPTDATH